MSKKKHTKIQKGSDPFWILMLIILVMGGGCSPSHFLPASPSLVRARFDISQEMAWTRVLEALRGWQLFEAKADKGYIETEWIEDHRDHAIGTVRQDAFEDPSIKRIKLFVDVREIDPNQTEIRLTSRVEQRALASAQTFGWQPVPSDGRFEEKIFGQINKRIEDGSGEDRYQY